MAYLAAHGLNHISYKAYTTQCGPGYPYDLRTYVHVLITCLTCYLVSTLTLIVRWRQHIPCHSDLISDLRGVQCYNSRAQIYFCECRSLLL